ncbi:MAG: GNAT family N-acetyltransferase [Tissierellia bacterium]|nr:GNAT family N-acetyltransferase [Tissierellia bacterium]
MEFKTKEGLIYLGEEKSPKAYISYTVEDGVMKIEHTVVRRELEGQGIARKLTDKAVEVAKENSWKVYPICSYAVAYFKKHEELKDLLA